MSEGAPTGSPREPARVTRSWLPVVWAIGTLACGPPCLTPDQHGTVVPPSPAAPVPAQQPSGRAQQAIVEEAATAVSQLSRQPRFASIGRLLEHARAVAIFPQLIKASLVFGGEGGTGVLVVKGSDGSWSLPAFYSLGAPSIGLQAGVQATTVLLFIMDDITVERMLYSSLTLGVSTSATIGQVGERDLADAELLSKNIFELSEASGAFAGVSFDGYVITVRQKHNDAYYGAGSTPQGILFKRTHRRPEAIVLLRALESAASSASDSTIRPEDDASK